MDRQSYAAVDMFYLGRALALPLPTPSEFADLTRRYRALAAH